MARKERRNGFAVVILGMVLQSGVLAQMWLTAPMIARVAGPAAYGFALVITAITVAIFLFILDDQSLRAEPRRAASPKLQGVRLHARNL